jgi:hypothetical protein
VIFAVTDRKMVMSTNNSTKQVEKCKSL